MELATKERAKMRNKNRDRSFIGRNAGLNYFLLLVLYPIATVFSVFTEGSALHTYFSSFLPSPVMVWCLVGLVVVALEAGKFWFAKSLVVDLRDKVWTDNAEDVAMMALKMIAVVLFFGFSINLSITGADDTTKAYRNTYTPPTLISADSIRAYYDSKIEAERADITAAKSVKWKGTITVDARRLIAKAKDNIAEYENALQSALMDAKDQNDTLIGEHKADTENTGAWMTRLAGLGEVTAILILVFLGVYESGAVREVTAANPAATGGGKMRVIEGGEKYEATPRQAIGFRLPEVKADPQKIAVEKSPYNGGQSAAVITAEPPQRKPTAKTAVSDDGKKYPTAACDHCGGEYEKTVWNKRFCSTGCKEDYHAAKHGGEKFDAGKYRTGK